MTYYHLPTNTERSPGRLETKLSDGAQLGPPDTGWTAELAALCGFVTVVNTARPADTPTETYVRSVVRIGDVVSVVWTARLWTADELAAQQANVNGDTIRDRAALALTGNSAFLALATPTNAEAVAQIRALTRQVNGLIRLTIGHLDTITDA